MGEVHAGPASFIDGMDWRWWLVVAGLFALGPVLQGVFRTYVHDVTGFSVTPLLLAALLYYVYSKKLEMKRRAAEAKKKEDLDMVFKRSSRGELGSRDASSSFTGTGLRRRGRAGFGGRPMLGDGEEKRSEGWDDEDLGGVGLPTPRLSRKKGPRRVYKGRTDAQRSRIRRNLGRGREESRAGDVEEHDGADCPSPRAAGVLEARAAPAPAGHGDVARSAPPTVAHGAGGAAEPPTTRSSAPSPSRAKRSATLDELLGRVGLSEYREAFEKEALTDVGLLRGMATDEPDALRRALADVGVAKVGHREAILRALRTA